MIAETDIRVGYKPRKWAVPFHASFARWLVLVLHRRAGKTTSVINQHQRAATDDAWEERRLRALSPNLSASNVTELLRGRWYGHILPTYTQAELVAWGMLKRYAQAVPNVRFREDKLRVIYPPTERNPSGSTFQLFGADKPDSLRGPAFSGLSFDEYGQHPPNIFSEVLSKSLADHLGYAVFVGTIKGKNQLFKYYQAAMKAIAEGDASWFAIWQDIERSLATETNTTTLMLRQAMHDDRQLILKGLMLQSEYDQEWLLSTDAAIKGAYYAKELIAASKQGRITRVPYDPILPVDTDWDLGYGDAMSIWMTQTLRSGEVHVIDYYENSGEGLPHYVKVLSERGYVYGKHWAPHDIEVHELGTGKTRREVAAALGLKFQVTPKLGLDDGINAARLLLPRCWFDAEKTEVGVEALRHYRKGFNEKMQQFTDQPVHDFSSHPADAFRGLAVRHKPEKVTREKAKPDPFAAPPSGLGWMA